MDNGPPRMLFEDGQEKSYRGPTNALSGGVSQGYWTGVIPKANKAPVNLLDNIYMAYHIENQTDDQVAKMRMVKRLQAGINSKGIDLEKDPVEYRIAILTLEHIKKYKNIFGVEISNSLMQNGLGASIRNQMMDNTGGYRKGVLPKGVKIDGNLDLQDGGRPVKRAAEVAMIVGDDRMASKFQRIENEYGEMMRIASEYLEDAREKQGGKNLNPSEFERMILENSLKMEQMEEKYAKKIINSINRPLIELLKR